MAAADTPVIKLVAYIPATPVVPAGAQRATVNVHFPGGSAADGTATGVQDGFISFEASMAAAPAAWQASHAYAVGNLITDSNGQVQECIAETGNSGSSAPAWGTGLGETTTDNDVTWQNVGTSPSALVAGKCSVYITQP
jgi:hypothetical protein